MSTMQQRTDKLAAQFKSACIAELEALKPGNVHALADGHGMTVQDFLKSAEAAASVIARPGLTVGQRILQAVQATADAVGCNTNLGIILLCVPLIEAAFPGGEELSSHRLQVVLDQLTVDDARDAYAAIRIANPAGLGSSDRHDVGQPASATLLAAMHEAADRDMIARQYANGYREVFDALAYYRRLLARWERPAWAVSGLYLRFLATFPDSHIVRKYGAEQAENIRQQAVPYWQELESRENPKTYLRPLLDFDRDLKAQSINPGTSADMTVAVLLLAGLVSER
ncbi:hypothetical protein MTYP_02247 [Methylophilaceae bacterium]|nr:hypothetical protein MTYP_02247 [Methylophilaceae bacterium]